MKSESQKPEQEDDMTVFERNIEKILSKFNESKHEKDIMSILKELYECLDKNKLLGSKITSKMKIQILKCLYKQVECQNEELLLQVARIILTVNYA